jgi:hypothetical protein
MAAAHALGQEVALEASAPDDRVLPSADDTDLVPTDSFRVVPVGDPSSSHQLTSHDLGVPSFFSNLQVTWFLLIWLYPRCDIVLTLICFQCQALVDEMVGQLRSQGASVPERALSLAHWNPVLLQRRVSDLEMANAG